MNLECPLPAGSRYKLHWNLRLPYSSFATVSGMLNPGVSQLQKPKKYFSKNFEAWMNDWYSRRGASGFSEKRVFLSENYGRPPLIEKGGSFLLKACAVFHLF